MRQKSIEVHGLSHRSAPIPMGCRIGPVLATSGIGGKIIRDNIKKFERAVKLANVKPE